MSYNYTDGDGLSVLDKTKPDGATEPVSALDDAIRQIKAYLKDPIAGVAALASAVSSFQLGGYSFRAYKGTAAQTYHAGSGEATVILDQISFNTADVYSSITNKFKAVAAGRYFFKGQMHIALTSGSPSNVDITLKLMVNGVAYCWSKSTLSDETGGRVLSVCDLVQLGVNDEVSLAIQVVTTGASTWTLANTSADCNFSGYRITSS